MTAVTVVESEARPLRSTPGQRRLGYALLAALAYVPVLLAHPGKVVADTKQYLYLDPGRVLERAWSMWDSNIGFGTVTHQNIGYLFPMGPWYRAFDALGVPDWVSQRLWLGSVLFMAGLGMLFLFRTIGLRGAGAVVGTLYYVLTPYWLEYAARLSVLLLPWAGLPWMIALLVRGYRRGGWRHAALFALLIQVIGSVNVTALVYAGIGPLLWVPYAIWVDREVSARRVLATVGKFALLTIGASFWWMSGLWAQGAYGLDILRYTETMRVVSRTTLPNEVWRGLGYWFFYGRDRLGPWIEASTDYTMRPGFIVTSYLVPTLALLAAAVVRWRHRVYFAAVAVLGVVIAVGAHPYDSPTPIGAAFKKLSQGSTVAFALRSTGRAVPLVVLGLAGLMAAGVTALVDRWAAAGVRRPRFRIAAIAVPVVVGILLVVNLPALATGGFYGSNLQRPEEIPQYWKDAIAHLDAQPHDTRALELPGSDFGSYRWGQTVDPITPGLMDRPYVARELIPYGSAASANLLNAFDLRLQDRQLDPDAIAPLMREMAVGDVVLRNDIQFERYRLLRPLFTWDEFTPTPAGLREPVTFGKPTSAQSTQYPFLDEQALLANPDLQVPPPVAVFPVARPSAIVRSKSPESPVVIAGDGDGMVDAAEAGLLANDPLIQYSASNDRTPSEIRRAVANHGVLVVTDSNRDRGRRWSTLTETQGYTEGRGTRPLVEDEADARLDLFPDQSPDAQTVTVLSGARAVAATSYGNAITYTPEDRPARAFDGDPTTAWRVGQFDDVRGARIRIVLDAPITTDHVNLVQVLTPPNDRWITNAVLRFDGEHDLPVTLDASSRTADGQTITFPSRTFRSFEVEVRDTNVGQLDLYGGQSPVGFGEIRLQDAAPGSAPVVVHETLKMPNDLLRIAGRSSLRNPLVILMTRQRVGLKPARRDPEAVLDRTFRLPTARVFRPALAFRLSRNRTDSQIDRTLGYEGPVTADSSARLLDAPAVRASAALDQDPATAWTTPFKEAVGSSVDVAFGSTRTVDHLDLALRADGSHSVPSEITVTDRSGLTRTVPLTLPAGTSVAGGVLATTARFDALRSSGLKIEITKVRPVTTLEYDCGCQVETPAAVVEFGVPGLAPVRPPARIPATCRTDLFTVDGRTFPVALDGSTADAVQLDTVSAVLCARRGTEYRVALDAGKHQVVGSAGTVTGFDLDRVVLASRAGGGASADLAADGVVAARRDRPAPVVRVLRNGRASASIEVEPTAARSWLVLGQSHNAGWQASIDGKSLGAPQLVDGYANGWRVPAHKAPVIVDVEWTPQRTVERSIAMSLVTVTLCLGIVLVSYRRQSSPRLGSIAVLARADVEPTIAPVVTAADHVSVTRRVVAAVIVGLFAAVAVNPVVGLAGAIAVALVLTWPRLRRWFVLAAPAFVLLDGLYIAVRQVRHDFPPIFEWPTFFGRARLIGWLVVVVLAADVVIELAVGRRRRAEVDVEPPDPDPSAPADPPDQPEPVRPS